MLCVNSKHLSKPFLLFIIYKALYLDRNISISSLHLAAYLDCYYTKKHNQSVVRCAFSFAKCYSTKVKYDITNKRPRSKIVADR